MDEPEDPPPPPEEPPVASEEPTAAPEPHEAPAAHPPLEIYPTFALGLKVAFKNFGPLVAIYLPLALVSTAFLFIGAPTFADPPTDPTQRLVIPPNEWLVFAGLMLYLFSFGTWTTTATYRAAAEAVEGRPVPSFGRAYGSAIERVPAVLGAQFLFVLALVPGLLCCLVPGLWLLVLFLPALPRAATRDVGPVQALRESKQLVEGRFWKCAGYVVLMTVVTYALLMPLFVLRLALPHGEPWAYWTLAAANLVVSVFVAVIQSTQNVVLHDRLELTEG